MKKKPRRDYRGYANKAERLFNKARGFEGEERAKIAKEALHWLRKSYRLKCRRHAVKFGYLGGLYLAQEAAEMALEGCFQTDTRNLL